MAAKLTYNADWYTPSNIRQELTHGDMKSVRKEYTRLRNIAQKRLKRLEAAGYSKTNVFRMNVKHYPVLKDIHTTAELAQRLADLSRFVEAKRSTVSGLRKAIRKALTTLSEHGYNFITEDNIQDFGRFMEEFRESKMDILYDSGDAYDLFTIAEKKHINKDKIKKDFESWLNERETIERMVSEGKSARSISIYMTKKAKEREAQEG